MRLGPPRRAVVGALALAGLAVWTACSGVDEGNAPATGLSEPAPVGRLGRIFIAVQAPSDGLSDVPALEISARFVQYRGLDEAAVRHRVDLPPLVVDRLRVGECTASDAVWADEPPPTPRGAGPDSREIALFDVGNIAVTIGEASVDVPLSLVPDILPYMSGVVYDHASEALPTRAWPPGEPAPTALTITVEGAGDDELPGFAARVVLPEPVALQTTPTADRGSLLLEWDPDGRGLPIALRLASYIGSESADDEVTCLVSDAGSHRIDLDALRAAGFGLTGDTLHVGASRFARARLDPGEAAYGDAEAVVEVRSETLVTWP
ncbi:MAG: hypothetical protein JNL82_20650 [Myxococcales bacterium]|nr:hypothetical protein [Myxococcales bacterium]